MQPIVGGPSLRLGGEAELVVLVILLDDILDDRAGLPDSEARVGIL